MPLSHKRTSILNDVFAVIEHMNANKEKYMHSVSSIEDNDNELPKPNGPRYSLLSNSTEKDHYYSDVAICRFLFYDIYRGTNLTRLLNYVPQLRNVDYTEIEKIYFDSEPEEFVISLHSREIRIYRGDVKYIYPFFCQIRDSVEYELVFDGDKVYSLNKFNDEPEASSAL
jgi:hypothetical protein